MQTSLVPFSDWRSTCFFFLPFAFQSHQPTHSVLNYLDQTATRRPLATTTSISSSPSSGKMHPPIHYQPKQVKQSKQAKQLKRVAKKKPVQSSNWSRPGVFRFMDLPAELRELVYNEFYLHGTVRICGSPQPPPRPVDYTIKAYIPKPKDSGKQAKDPKKGFPFLCQTGSALLRVNRQVHAEASPILYSKNTFEFLVAKHIRLLVRDAEANLGRIRSITVRASPFGDYMQESLAKLGECTGLRSLVIRCPGLNLPNHVEVFSNAVAAMLVSRSNRSKVQASFLEMMTLVNEKWRDEGEPSQEATQRLRSEIKRKLRLA